MLRVFYCQRTNTATILQLGGGIGSRNRILTVQGLRRTVGPCPRIGGPTGSSTQIFSVRKKCPRVGR